MKIKVLTIFPEMFHSFLSTSVIGRAVERGLIEVEPVDIRQYAQRKHKNTDDYPYGGGAGMVMLAQPVVRAIREHTGEGFAGRRVYLSPRGRVFDQAMAQALSREPELLLLCGHYEGVDQRALDLEIDEEVSIGDYVLTGGELGAMVLVDAVARLLPGVLGSDESAGEESFSDGLLEYPHYTRPRIFEGRAVPGVLLSGDHAKIARWRRERSLELTRARRPELLARAPLTAQDRAFLTGLSDGDVGRADRSALDAMAARALSQYGLTGAALHFIRHNENYTARVDATQGEYLLRLHAPAPGVAIGESAGDEAMLEAELRFIEAMAAGTGIALQQPIRTVGGRAVASLDAAGVGGTPGGAATLYATLLRWLPGENFDPSGEGAPQIAEQLGRLMATMHEFSAGFSEGAALTRPRYDRARLMRIARQLERGVEAGALTEKQLGIVKSAAEAIGRAMDALDARGDQAGLIHADLSPGNLIVFEGRLSPIDFSLSGHGYFYQDVGGVIAALDDPALRRAVLRGYRGLRALPEADLAYVEAFFVMSILLFMAMHLDNTTMREWFSKKLDRALYKYFLPLIQGRRFYPALLGGEGSGE